MQDIESNNVMLNIRFISFPVVYCSLLLLLFIAFIIFFITDYLCGENQPEL